MIDALFVQHLGNSLFNNTFVTHYDKNRLQRAGSAPWRTSFNSADQGGNAAPIRAPHEFPQAKADARPIAPP